MGDPIDPFPPVNERERVMAEVTSLESNFNLIQDALTSFRDSFNALVDELNAAPPTGQNLFLGEYETLTALQTAHATADVGEWALVNPVGAAPPVAYYWDGEAGAWTDAKENALGNPASDGQILSSTTAGARSWIDPPSGGLDSGTTFPGSPSDGQLFYRTDDQVMYFWDASRSKWLSEEVLYFKFGFAGLFDDRYLDLSGAAATGQFGYNMEEDITLVGVTGRGGSNPTKAFEIDRNTTLGIATFSLTANVVNEKNLNIDFDEDDYLRLWCSSAGASVLDPNITIIGRYRGT